MAYIEVSETTDMFDLGYHFGYQNGVLSQAFDQENKALLKEQDAVLYGSGYRTGYRNGQNYQLARFAVQRMLALNVQRQIIKEQERQRRRSVVRLLSWLLWMPFSRLFQFVKAIW